MYKPTDISMERVNFSKLTLLVFLVLTLLFSAVFTTNASAQIASSTGSYLGGKALSSTIVKMTGADEVNAIRVLLQADRKNEALNAAHSYIDTVSSGHDRVRSYYAYNALCTVQTSVGQLNEAIESCTLAMSFDTTKWSAVNNRGTAKMVAGQYDDALTDYRSALSLTPSKEGGVLATIQHNIDLVSERSR